MDLSIDDGLVLYHGRIVVPQAARRDILKKLHSSHQGITRTKRRARQALYLPGMPNDIVLLVEGCQPCHQARPSLPKEPMILEPPPHCIFEDVSADLFQHGNLHGLVYIDRLSGWPAVHRWHRDPTAKDIIAAIAENFVDLGVPNRFRSDGGPQFAAGAFQQFLHRWGVAPADRLHLHLICFISTLPPGHRPCRSSRKSNGEFHTQACSNRRLFLRSIFPGPTRATQHTWRNWISPSRDRLRPQPAFDPAGPPFFICGPLESCLVGA